MPSKSWPVPSDLLPLRQQLRAQRRNLPVAEQHQAALVPFFLKGIADGPDPVAMFQPDRIHPRAEAHPQMLNNVWPALRKLLR